MQDSNEERAARTAKINAEALLLSSQDVNELVFLPRVVQKRAFLHRIHCVYGAQVASQGQE